ncbi:hypothetical protein BTO30_00785 [Domibacillus antri]|uniref:DUF4003 domain-containing protein n=1 Tax=Domibacillus antri TaxID=1714264 RepID=A0A1Q8Q9H1_9BACI|nr:DUF4003 family protein [Domibacillus antri]OLN23989.1 hypothetical protein BTO30_00785 [Domibacillus antri]
MVEVKLLEENAAILRKTAGKWMDKRLVLLTAAQFAARQERIDEREFTAVSNKIKKTGSIFSPLRTIHFPMTGLLMTKEGDPDESLEKLLLHYETLRSAGFRSSVYTYIAAFLVEGSTKPERIKEIFEEMKRYHRFLTSHEDYPAAVIMAKRPESAGDLVDSSERYYRLLNDHGFWKGNDLQFLANMLVMDGLFQKQPAESVLQAKSELEGRGLRVKSMHYPALGVIALSGKIEEAAKMAKELKDTQQLKWSKDMAITISAIFAPQAYIDSSAGLTASVQAMVQAQQAAIAATAAGVFAASSSSDS